MNDTKNIIVAQAAKPPKPTAIAPKVNNIPNDLKQRRAWCWWQYGYRPNGAKPWTKVPRQINGSGARSNASHTWTGFDSAHGHFVKKAKHDQADGVGFFLHDDLVGVDIDDCIHDGQMNDTAKAVIERFGSYAEVSPSGTGIRIFCHGKLPPHDRKNGKYEIYDASSPRFLTVTGHNVDGVADVRAVQEAVNWFHATYIARPNHEKERMPKIGCDSPNLTESKDFPVGIERLISIARAGDEQLDQLFESNTDKPSLSEADAEFVSRMSYYCWGNSGVIDDAYRRSGLFRDKWDELRGGHTYGQLTLTKFSHRDNYYDMYEVADELVEDFETQLERIAGKPQKRRLYRVEDLEQLEPANWLVKGHFTEDSIVCLYGDYGKGKSFLALDWALCVAAGQEFLDKHEVDPGGVLYVYSEGIRSLKFRIRAWKEQYGVGDDKLRNVVFSGSQFNFCDTSEMDTILGDAQVCLGCKPRLIVIDTLNKNLNGDENDNRDMGDYLANVNLARELTGACVISVHHQGKDRGKGLRGHSSLGGGCDTIIHVDGTGDVMHVRCEKQKDHQPFAAYTLKKRVFTVGMDRDGEDVTSCVWWPQDEGDGDAVERAVLAVLKSKDNKLGTMDVINAVRNAWSGDDMPGQTKIKERLRQLRDWARIEFEGTDHSGYRYWVTR
jgi:hypothetical protein